MATKETHTITAYGRNITVVCETYRRGYTNYERATCDEFNVKGLYSYQNRPWQSCTFDCALSDLAKKVGRIDKTIGGEIEKLHDRIVKGDADAAEAMFNRFENAWNSASDRTKEALKDTILISENDVDAVTSGIEMMNVIDALCG